MARGIEINRTIGVLGNIGGTIFLEGGWSFTGSMGGPRNSPWVRFKELDLLKQAIWFFLRKQTWLFTKDFFAEGDNSFMSLSTGRSQASQEVAHLINICWFTQWHTSTVVWEWCLSSLLIHTDTYKYLLFFWERCLLLILKYIIVNLLFVNSYELSVSLKKLLMHSNQRWHHCWFDIPSV